MLNDINNKKNDIEIDHISDKQTHMMTVAKWMQEEWGTKDNFDFFYSIVSHSLDRKALPQTFIALDGKRPVATIGIWRCDMVSRQDLSPWISALYVVPDYRGIGIGKMLQDHATAYSKQLGFSEIYLYSDIKSYYEKSGWTLIDRGIRYSGEYDQIYRKTL